MTLDKVIEFIEKYNKIPLWKNEQELRKCLNKNIRLFHKKKLIESDEQKIINLIDNHKSLFYFNENKLQKDVDKLKQFIDTNERKPSKNEQEKYLIFIWRKIRDRYDFKIYLNKKFADDLYIKFISNPKYRLYFGRITEKWTKKLNIIIKYLEENGKLPEDDKNRKWINYQKKFCKIDNLLYNKEIVEKWENFKSTNNL